MKNKNALSWIHARVKREIPLLVLLIFCNAFLSVCNVSIALFIKGMMDAAQLGEERKLLQSAVLFFVILCFQILLFVCVKELEVRVSGKMEMRLKGDLYSAILTRDFRAVSQYHTGELLTRLTSDVTVVSNSVTSLLPNLVSMLTQAVCAFLVILSLDWRFALLLLAAGLVVFTVTMLFRGRLKKMHKDVQETDGKLRSFMQETLESLLTVQVFGIQKQTATQADNLQENHFKALLRRNHWSIFANAGLHSVFNFGVFFTLLWSGIRLCAGQITFGTLTALMQLVNRVQIPLSGLSGLVPQYYAMLSSTERLMEMEDLPEDAPKNADAPKKETLCQTFRALQFQKVSFSYGENTVLQDVNFEIRRNEFIAISGISGIGKSTLLKLLLGVLTPDSGAVTIETTEQVYKAGRDVRSLFSYVPQGNLLLSGTVRENLCLTRKEANEAEIREAIRLACADTFIDALPKGLDTLLGEGGKGLSEGQLQRLAVARAILSNAPILLLDEATSALDEATERQMLSNLRTMHNKTCIFISHKTAATEICDKEMQIQNGNVCFL